VIPGATAGPPGIRCAARNAAARTPDGPPPLNFSSRAWQGQARPRPCAGFPAEDPTSADRDTRLNPLAALVFSSRWLQLPLAAASDALANGYTGITCAKVTATGVMWQTNIHTIFILSALGIAWTDKAMTGSSSKREQHAH